MLNKNFTPGLESFKKNLAQNEELDEFLSFVDSEDDENQNDDYDELVSFIDDEDYI